MSNQEHLIRPTILDSPSENIFAWEDGGIPQTGFMAMTFQGECDTEAFARAIDKAQSSRPFMSANLRATRYYFGLLNLMAWHPSEMKCRLKVKDFSGVIEPVDDVETWLHRQMADEVLARLNLREEFPFAFTLFLLPDNKCSLVMKFHHVAADGGRLYELMRDIMRHYHRFVTGSDPAWAKTPAMHAQAGGAVQAQPASTWQFLRDQAAEFRKYPLIKAVQMASEPDPKPGRHMVRFVIDDPETQQALRRRARRTGASLSDLFLAASKLALQQWNRERNASTDIMMCGLAVNQRGRQGVGQVGQQGNPMSMIAVPSNDDDRLDAESLLRHVVKIRKEKLAHGQDILLARLGARILFTGRILPLKYRYRLLLPIIDAKISLFVSNLGLVWPEVVDGKPTGDTAIDRVGDLRPIDIHLNTGSTPKNHVSIILQTFQNKLIALFSFGRHGVSDRDGEAFAKLVMEKVMAYL